ncbi:MAG: hypothetical protein LBV30_01290 [Propionibacteriaceae bacterium]|nr:hypothetical protein [Propionibacteriaceae bacterium]
MDRDTALRLTQLTSAFYRRHAASFSASRDHPWPGWQRCRAAIDAHINPPIMRPSRDFTAATRDSSTSCPSTAANFEAASLSPTVASKAGNLPAHSMMSQEADLTFKSGPTVLDLACGNQRFADFLEAQWPATPWDYQGVDLTAELLMAAPTSVAVATDDQAPVGVQHTDRQSAAWVDPTNPTDRGIPTHQTGSTVRPLPAAWVDPTNLGNPAASQLAPSALSSLHPDTGSSSRRSTQLLDIVGALMTGDLAEQLACRPARLSVSFGFLHHLAWSASRSALLNALIDQTAAGGLIILTAWQFADDPIKRHKAQQSTDRALARLGFGGLKTGDYLLGWHGDETSWRYCHSFSDAEIDQLIASAGERARLIERFRADGKSGQMNTYLLFEVA